MNLIWQSGTNDTAVWALNNSCGNKTWNITTIEFINVTGGSDKIFLKYIIVLWRTVYLCRVVVSFVIEKYLLFFSVNCGMFWGLYNSELQLLSYFSNNHRTSQNSELCVLFSNCSEKNRYAAMPDSNVTDFWALWRVFEL